MNDGRLIIGDESGYETIGADLSLDTIQKILVVNDRTWVFGYDLFMVVKSDNIPTISYPFRLSTGAPL